MTGAPTEQPARAGAGAALALSYSAISDVGRVRKDNQDAGYAGPWLLVVCDGVGGAARGDVASATAVTRLRDLDEPPTGRNDLLDRVAAGLDAAHVAIGRLVDEDATLKGTSTTATVAAFDGTRVGLGHVGDSRAYLLRNGELSQLTSDHTFVQTLVDEGRISEDEALVHPHRHVILKALDGVHDLEPDLFAVQVVAGDRLLLCSDGASGVLRPERITSILRDGSPDYAAVELVRASLEAGSSDNVTCLVADVLEQAVLDADPALDDLEPLLVGAAAELRRRPARGAALTGSIGLFRGHRSGDTGELEPVDAEIAEDQPAARVTDPVDPETARYAPRAPKRFVGLRRVLVLGIVAGLVWVAGAAAYSWSQRQFYVGESEGRVTIFRGLDADVPGLSLSTAYETSDVDVSMLSDFDARRVARGIDVSGIDAARDAVQSLAGEQSAAPEPETGIEPSTEPSTEPTATPTAESTVEPSVEPSAAASGVG